MIKLIGYNLKFGRNKHLMMALIILLVAVMVRVLSSDQGSVGSSIAIASYMLLIVGSGIGSMVVIFSGLYRNTFGKQGYLMQTLPVSKGRLVGSQYIVAMIWFNLMWVVTALSIGILLIGQGDALKNIDWGWMDAAAWISVIIMCNVFVLYLIAAVFTGMTFANCSFYFRRVNAIVATIVGFLFLNIVPRLDKFLWDINFPMLYLVRSSSGMRIVMEHEFKTISDLQGVTDITIVLITLIFTAVAYFITVWLMKKKTDL